MTASHPRLDGVRVFLSASIPAELEQTHEANEAFYRFLLAFVGGLLAAGGSLLSGGHPSIIRHVPRVVETLGLTEPRITLFQLAKFRKNAPPAIFNRRIFGDPIWIGPDDLADDQVPAQLTIMRQQIAALADAAVFVGGKTTGSLTPKLGIREEYELLHAGHKPTYLLGLLEGATSILIEEQETSGAPEHNTLDDRRRRLLHRTADPSLAASIVLDDLHAAVRRDVT